MKFTEFKIKNFKGIEDITINLDKSPNANIYTLVGLNESGKTTILEAINLFNPSNEGISALELPGATIKDYNSLIPISRRDNFNGRITIEVTIKLDDDDLQKINEFTAANTQFRQVRTVDTLKDPLGDVSESGYTEPKLSWHDDIDILKVRSRVAGDYVVLEMELAGEISENESVNYQFFIYTERHGFWTHNIDYRYPNMGGKMEKDGRILRARIPVDSLENRKMFGVIAIASDNEKGLYDNWSNSDLVEQIMEILTAPP